MCSRLPGPLLTETSTVECKIMRGTCFGAEDVESMFGKLAFGDLAFDNFLIIHTFVQIDAIHIDI